MRLATFRRGGDPRSANAWEGVEQVRVRLPMPEPDTFLCVRTNDRAHLEELTRSALIREVSRQPTGFVKVASCLAGHHGGILESFALFPLSQRMKARTRRASSKGIVLEGAKEAT